ncbi:MAG: sensor histidine kinase, partial [Desulfovibrio sp.]|nr:sensor histidine kinase [Desulfovibrio sp.]
MRKQDPDLSSPEVAPHCSRPYADPAEEEAVLARIREKIRQYAAYRFSSDQSCALNIFFDLSQEFEGADRLYLLCVLILRTFFGLDAEFYARESEGKCVLRTPKIGPLPSAPPPLEEKIRREGDVLYLPVRGKQARPDTTPPSFSRDALLGVLAVRLPQTAATAGVSGGEDSLFLAKFANRVGYSLHNRLLAERNLRHVLFLRNLAQDIGHNVITPNMRLKFMLRQLEEQIATLGGLLRTPPGSEDMDNIRSLHAALSRQAEMLGEQFQNGALFLESLLRQSHFDLGRYALRCVRLDIGSQVVVPQLKRFRARLEERGIRMAPEDCALPATPCLVMADFGLISQVLANFLGNAVKYALPQEPDSCPRIRSEVRLVADAFPEHRPGAKVSVWS